MKTIDAYIEIKNDLDLNTLKEISHTLNVKLGWITTAQTRVERVFGRLPLSGISIHSMIMEFKEPDIEKVKKLLEQKNIDFCMEVKETKTIYECKSKGYIRDDI